MFQKLDRDSSEPKLILKDAAVKCRFQIAYRRSAMTGIFACRNRLLTVLSWVMCGLGHFTRNGVNSGKGVDRCWSREKIYTPIPSMISIG
jgi:hypothetical protein